MLKLSVNDIVKHNENCYSFVIAVAKKARQIAEEANENGDLLDEKPVQMAVEDFVEGKFHIVDHKAEPSDPQPAESPEQNPEQKQE